MITKYIDFINEYENRADEFSRKVINKFKNIAIIQTNYPHAQAYKGLMSIILNYMSSSNINQNKAHKTSSYYIEFTNNDINYNIRVANHSKTDQELISIEEDDNDISMNVFDPISYKEVKEYLSKKLVDERKKISFDINEFKKYCLDEVYPLLVPNLNYYNSEMYTEKSLKDQIRSFFNISHYARYKYNYADLSKKDKMEIEKIVNDIFKKIRNNEKN